VRRFITFVLLLIAIGALFPLYTRYKVMAAPIPPGVHLGGLELSEIKDPVAIRQHLESIYQEPAGLYFGEERVPLLPAAVEFTVDADQMVHEATRYLEGTTFIDIAVREALGFPQQRRDVPVRFTLNIDKLRAWLTNVAAEHNRPPTPPRALAPKQEWAQRHCPPTLWAPSSKIGSGSRGNRAIHWRSKPVSHRSLPR
jgi:hypothetical protein